MGFARLAENSIRNARGVPTGERLSTLDRVAASALGGALGCWNQPIEVVRVEVSLSYLSELPLSKLTFDSSR
jgi:hypothetical protein